MPNIELYIHRITFSVSAQLFFPYNDIIHISCNIGTASHLLFTKSRSSELQECLGKIIFPIEFFQFHLIFILLCNEWFGCLHTIWVCYGKTLFLSFCGFIFHNTSPIIWLMQSCHLFCINSALFIYSNEIIPPLNVALCWDIGRTIWCQVLLLVTCWMKYWRCFPAPYISCRFDWQERGLLLYQTPYIICMLPLLLIPSTCFKISRLMGSMLIEFIKKKVESYSSFLPVAENVVMSWTLAYVICVWWFNGNINYSR